MSIITTKVAQNKLLDDIKAAVDTLLLTQSSDVITNELRRELLHVLVSYSDRIPHPASTRKSQRQLQEVSDSHMDDDYDNKANERVLVSQTLVRWQILAYVAGVDLTIAKWFESHLDALSILHEIGYDAATEGLWAVWAAEGNPQPICYDNEGFITGSKGWCSGAHIVDKGLMTYRDEQGQSQLIVVYMNQTGIDIDNGNWQAVGMQDTDTATVTFNHAKACLVGAPNAYLDRVGFWHGAAGVAACWYGATAYIADYLVTAYQQKPNNYKAMHLGKVTTAMLVTQQYFNHTAGLIDREPHQNHELTIRALRANVEQLARLVLEETGQALGAAPFCLNAHFARLTADLTVFIRQSHGAFDLQQIGVLAANLAKEQDKTWEL